MEQMLKDALAAVYDRLVEKGDVVRLHPGIPRFTLERLKPQLRAELDRRILASADLIRLNRKNSIEKTLQRFVGWSTSIPKGGSDVVDKAAEKKKIRKSLAQLPFEERRVLIDQGHKLRASISEIVAKDGNAIAGVKLECSDYLHQVLCLTLQTTGSCSHLLDQRSILLRCLVHLGHCLSHL